MVTRADWDAAVLREDARFARYGRPATVLVIEIRAAQPDAVERIAPRVATIIREHARETDLVARVSPDHFHVLLPETLDTDAAILVERVKAATDALVGFDDDRPITLVGAAVTPGSGSTLADAIRRATERVASANE